MTTLVLRESTAVKSVISKAIDASAIFSFGALTTLHFSNKSAGNSSSFRAVL